MSNTPPDRWEALDLLRGLSVIAMLLSLTPGAWEHKYTWLIHAAWEGGNLIDMVAPAFLFCIGAVMPMSLSRRLQAGDSKGKLVLYVLWRAVALVVLGLFLNAYPVFDWAHLRIPGVMQRIGLSYGLAGLFVLATAKHGEGLNVSPKLMAGAAIAVLLSYWALLYFVPVPGFGAPRFDPVGSWPAYIDRAVFTVPHMFIFWPVNGKVVFDPDGLLTVWPTSALILLGAAIGQLRHNATVKRPIVMLCLAGTAMMAVALLVHGLCPIIKNIYSSSFILFSGGFSLALLGLLTILTDRFPNTPVATPVRVYGANPLLAYLICFLFGPVLDMNWIPNAHLGKVSLRQGNQLFFHALDPTFASFLFGVIYLVPVFFILWFCYRKRWFLRL